jgi:hypothetical protein
MLLWFVFVTPLSLIIIFASLNELIHNLDIMSGSPLLGIIGPVLLLGLGYLLVYSGRRIGRREIPFLRDYLRDTLDAVDAA